MGSGSDGEQVTSAANERAEDALRRTIQSAPSQVNDPAARLFAGHWLAENDGMAKVLGPEGTADVLAHAVTARGMPQTVVDGYRSIFASVLEPYFQGKGSPVSPEPQPPAYGADPVELYRGEFVHEETDLVVRGAGIDFAFVRTYRNQAVFTGPLGSKWDHAYNTTLRVTDLEARLWTGTLREEVYRRHPKWGQAGFTYYVPSDGIHATLEPIGVPDAPTGWARRAPDGVRHVFEPDPDWSGGFRLARIEDRFGNYLRFLYVDGRLRQVEVNHPARWANLAYDALGRIIRVGDHAGRAWLYEYDDNGDLAIVTTPPTPGYPLGNATSLFYSSNERTGALAHNLTRIIDAAGRCYLENRYGDGLADFNRVVWQRQGGGVTRFRYEPVNPIFPGELPPEDRPTMRVRVTERNGFETVNVYNGWGNLLRKEECWRGPGGHEHVVWRYRYNRDGLLVATRTPEGVVTCSVYGRTDFVRKRPGLDEDTLFQHDNLTADLRRGFARVLSEVRRVQPVSGSGFDWNEHWGNPYVASAGDVIVKHTYEPAYGQPLTASNPLATTSPDPDGIEGPEYAERLTRFEYEGPAGDPTRALRRLIRPTPTKADGTPYGPVVEEILSRDDRGRVLSKSDAVGTETTFEYYLDADGSKSGFLKRQIADATGRHVTIDHDVDELGRVIATTLPRGVESADGRFVVRTAYDAFDRVTSQRGPTPLDTETRKFYEPTGQIARTEADWISPGKAGLDPVVRTFAYDEEHHVTRETIGGRDVHAHLLTRHKYGPSGERTLTLLPEGNDVRFKYDQRVQLVATIRGYGTGDMAAARVIHDRDGRLIETITPEGRSVTHELDGLGRAVATTDALGHATRTTYDKAGRATVVRHFERRDDGTYWLLARSEVDYDELGRKRRDIANLFDDPLSVSDLEHDYELAPGPGTRMVTAYEYDAAGRVTLVVDPLARRSKTVYDALGRVAATIDALGNRVEFQYDAHGNVIRRDRRDLVRDASGNVIGEEVFPWEGTYDERDRLVAERDALGNVTAHAYDSLDRRVSTTDPLGNVVTVDYDVYGRQVAVTHERTDTGQGGGEALPAAVQRTEYDKNRRATARIDPLGRRTQIRFDTLDRPIERIFPRVGSETISIRTFYDRDGFETRRREAHGAVVVTERDGLGRPVRTLVDLAELDVGVVIEGTNQIVRRFDGLGRTIHAENETAAIDTTFDSLGRARRVDTTLAGTPRSLRREYNDAGALTALVYPGGRRLEHDRDELSRLRTLTHAEDGAGYPGVTGATRVLASWEHVGGRVHSVDYGNGARIEQAFDVGGRLVERSHLGAMTPTGRANLLRLQYLHDGARNPRLRLDATASGVNAERFAYDSEYQLIARRDDAGRIPFDPAPLAPAMSPPPTPIPNTQAEIDLLLGAMPSGPADGWTYDLSSNRSTEALLGKPATDYQINDLDEYTVVGSAPRRYDRAGNLIEDDRFAYVHDVFFRLVRVIDRATGLDVAVYGYDSEGRRVVERHPPSGSAQGDDTAIAYDGPDRIADYRAGVCVAQYVHADAVDAPIHLADAVTGLHRERWLHADAAGSVRTLSDEAAAAVGVQTYTPFGAFKSQPVDGYCPFAFVGRPFDATLGLYDFRARAYDPSIGRFLERDPAGGDGSNLYAYAGNHPLRFTDPSGHDRVEIHGNVLVLPGDTPGDIVHADFSVPYNNRDDRTAGRTTQGAATGKANYVDNGILSVGTDADPLTLQFKTLNFVYADRRTLDVPLSSVKFDCPCDTPARYEQSGGFVYPIGQNGTRLYDPQNTPSVVAFARMKLTDQANLANQRVELAKTVLGFQIALGSLASAVAPGPEWVTQSAAGSRTDGVLRRIVMNRLGAQVDRAFESGNLRSGTMVQFNDQGGPLAGSGPKQGTGSIWYHDNVEIPGAGPDGADVELRTHSANPKAPAGTYSRTNYTTQINTTSGKYLLPDGTWKTIKAMSDAERAAAHIPAGN